MSSLFAIDGHELIDLRGNKSSLFRVTPPDLEQIDNRAKELVLNSLESDLMATDATLKIYSLGSKLYFNSFGELSLRHGEITPCLDPVETFISEYTDEVQFYENYLTCGTEYLRILSVKEFPTLLAKKESTKWPDFVLSLKKIPTLEAKAKLDLKRKLHFSLLFKGIRDIESENAYAQSEEILTGLTTEHVAIFEAEVFFILKANTKKALDNLTKKVIKDFKAKGAELRIEERGLSYFYQSLLPGVRPSFKRSMVVPSDYLSYLVPFHQSALMDSGLKLRARDGADLFLDIFSEEVPNYNVVISGESGQGKSMIANKILDFERSRGSKAIILDLGHSFEKNAKYHQGNILSERFNPLQFKDPRYLKEFIMAVIDEPLPKNEEGRLFEAVMIALESCKNSDFMSFLAEVEKSFDGISYYFSEIEEFFTCEEVPLNDLTYCDISNYPEAIKAPLIIYLIEYFKHLDGKKIFIFDECWHLLGKNADYISTCFRTFRKHLASAIAISQNLDDFILTPLGRAIVQSGHFKFFFRQSLKTSEFLSEHQKRLLDSVQSIKGQYSEFLIITENFTKPAQYLPTPLEYELFTSDRRDNNQFGHYQKEKGFFLPFKDAIHNYIQIKYPGWRINEQY